MRHIHVSWHSKARSRSQYSQLSGDMQPSQHRTRRFASMSLVPARPLFRVHSVSGRRCPDERRIPIRRRHRFFLQILARGRALSPRLNAQAPPWPMRHGPMHAALAGLRWRRAPPRRRPRLSLPRGHAPRPAPSRATSKRPRPRRDARPTARRAWAAARPPAPRAPPTPRRAARSPLRRAPTAWLRNTNPF